MFIKQDRISQGKLFHATQKHSSSGLVSVDEDVKNGWLQGSG